MKKAYFVGLPSVAKGIDDFAWLAKQFRDNISFYWLTHNVSTEMKRKFKEICFVENLDDKALSLYIERMDIFVSCSHHEGFSLPTAEAILLEKYVFSYKLPEIYASFGDSIGLYIPPFHLEIYQKMLEEYLVGKVRRNQDTLDAGKRMIISKYSPDAVKQKLLQVIKSNYQR